LIVILVIISTIIVGSVVATLISNDQTSTDLVQPQIEEKQISDLSSSIAMQIITECETQVNCVIDGLDEYSKHEKKSTVVVTLNNIISVYREFPDLCHPQAHELGKWLFGYIGDVKEAYSYVDERCGGAVRHSVVQSFFKEQMSNGANPNNIDLLNICSETTDNPFALERWHCIHGIGHGLATSYDYDVFSAVNRCEEFEPGWEQISCSKGVFMENVVYNSKTRAGDFKQDDLFYPCNAIDSKYTAICYHLHSPYVSLQNGYALKESFKDCDKILPEEFVKYCYHGMGRTYFPLILEDMKHSPGLCQVAEDPYYYGDCFRGMVMALLNERGIEESFEFCKLIPEQFKEDCYDGIGKWILMLHATDEGRERDCSKAENSEYVDVCIKASLENIILL